ncbi:MAG: hypothetical protein QW818_00675 [Candidatus Aenigmatarchaeota archaeon]|nr:hypothetical protein [Candidatus Aenigmarchaeota archaeon]
MKEFILSFDLPKEMAPIRSRLHRRLTSMKAVKIHDSFWKSQKLEELIAIAQEIKKFGGQASILEEKFIF